SLPLGITSSAISGAVASILGIGGAAVLVPVMVALLSFPAPIATATSTFILTFTSASASITHLVQGDFANVADSTVAAGLGMMLGAQVGARLSQRIGGKLLVRLFAGALAVAGLRLILGGA